MGFALKQEYLPEYTYQDYLVWEGRWEMIHGVPYAMTPGPSIDHQGINSNIVSQLNVLLQGCEKCKAYIPLDWKVSETTVVQPDVSVICQESGNKNYLDFAPTVIFEIFSPSTAKKDSTLKFELYESEGVKYYVLVSPDNRSVEVFELKKKRYENALKTQKGKFTFDLKECTVDFDFSKIWE